jgi:hypothetical protein
MSTDAIHRFHNVPDEAQWRRLFAAWRGHLRTVWDHDNDVVPWGYSERTNVALLASAHDKDGGVSMVELPFKRRAGQADEGAGRFDVWMARKPWQVYGEAKQAWAPACNDERIEHVVAQMNDAKVQAHDLKPLATGATVATLVFVVPYPSWTSATTPQSVVAEFRDFESMLWERHDKRSRTFQTSFVLPPSEIREIESVHHSRPRAFPGVILCGRIHKAGAP